MAGRSFGTIGVRMHIYNGGIDQLGTLFIVEVKN